MLSPMHYLPKVFILLLAIAMLAISQQSVTFLSLPNIAGTGAAVSLASTSVGNQTVLACQLISQGSSPSSPNVANIQWGDANISSTRGASMAPGSGQWIPSSQPSNFGQGNATTWPLSSVYVLIQSGDQLTVSCLQPRP
jgi:hypothetical protein